MIHIKRSPEINLTQQCYDQIQECIINGTFEPGKKLKVEKLKQQLTIGASPIREALSRLVASGLVEAYDNKGFYVTQISQDDVHDVYQTFLSIELLALTQAMKHGDDAWKTSIVAALYNLSLIETSEQPISCDTWIERNYAFHLALIAGCNSPNLLKIRYDIYQRFDRYCRMSFNITKRQLHSNHEEHKKLADAVLNRDLEKATTLMTHHILGSQKEVIVRLFP